MTAWKFSFENKIPGALQSSSSAPDGRLVDRFFGNMLPTERLRVCNFTEAAQKVEQVRYCPANLKLGGFLVYPYIMLILIIFTASEERNDA